MRMAIIFFLAGMCAAEASAQSLTAISLLRDARARVTSLERKADQANGSLLVSVAFNASVLGRSVSGNAKYRITIINGVDRKNQIIGKSFFSDSGSARMMAREFDRRLNKPMMDYYLDMAFPWRRFLAKAGKKRMFTATLDSDSVEVDGRTCFLISFKVDTQGDSISAVGGGRIWLDAHTLLPVRTDRDFNTKTSRGNAQVISTSEFGSIPSGVPVLLRSETRTVPKFLFLSVGSIKTMVEQSDFNLE
jgi:hypothetical protein